MSALGRTTSSFVRDNLVFFRNNYFFINWALAVLYLGIGLLLIPDTATIQPTLYATGTADHDLKERLELAAVNGVTPFVTVRDTKVLDAHEDLDDKVERRDNSVGVVVTDTGTVARIVFRADESERSRRLLEADLHRGMSMVFGDAGWEQAETTMLRDDAQPITFRRALLPLLLFSDAGMVGLIFIATLIFLEKESGVLRALMASPLRTWEYLVAKAGAVSVLALTFGMIFVPVAAGSQPNYPLLALVLASGAFCTALIGAAFAVWFRSLQEFFFPAILLINVLGVVPAAAYLIPSFEQRWMTLIPTYEMMFAVREAMFPTGDSAMVLGATFRLALLSAVFLVVASISFRRQLIRS